MPVVYTAPLPFCMTSGTSSLEINLFDKFIEEARELRPEYIHLQEWGEPLLHPDSKEFAKKLMF